MKNFIMMFLNSIGFNIEPNNIGKTQKTQKVQKISKIENFPIELLKIPNNFVYPQIEDQLKKLEKLNYLEHLKKLKALEKLNHIPTLEDIKNVNEALTHHQKKYLDLLEELVKNTTRLIISIEENNIGTPQSKSQTPKAPKAPKATELPQPPQPPKRVSVSNPSLRKGPLNTEFKRGK